MTSFYISLAFIWYVQIKNSCINDWVIPWYLPENWLKNFFLKKMVLDEWSWGDPGWSWTTWTWYHNWKMGVFGRVFLGGRSNGGIGKALHSKLNFLNTFQHCFTYKSGFKQSFFIQKRDHPGFFLNISEFENNITIYNHISHKRI